MKAASKQGKGTQSSFHNYQLFAQLFEENALSFVTQCFEIFCLLFRFCLEAILYPALDPTNPDLGIPNPES